MKLGNNRLTVDQMLNALMVDNLQFLCWTKTKDASRGKNRPKSLLQKLMGNDVPKDELMTFETIEDYEKHIRAISEGK